MDEAGRMIQQRYRRWYMALAEMPSWGSEMDRIVLKYLDGIRGIVLGSLLWRCVYFLVPFLLVSPFLFSLLVSHVLTLPAPLHSFWTGRYFNKEEGELLRRTRQLRLPVHQIGVPTS